MLVWRVLIYLLTSIKFTITLKLKKKVNTSNNKIDFNDVITETANISETRRQNIFLEKIKKLCKEVQILLNTIILIFILHPKVSKLQNHFILQVITQTAFNTD